jgi:hypothetical protein
VTTLSGTRYDGPGLGVATATCAFSSAAADVGEKQIQIAHANAVPGSAKLDTGRFPEYVLKP